MKYSVGVVIPNWNGADKIADCLKSLQKQTLNHQVIVVDNGSVDNSVELIEKKFPNVIVIKLPKNRGFAGGVNVGIEEAIKNGSKHVALLNNDAVADKDWLMNLLTGFKDKKTAIVTGRMLKKDKKTIDSTGEFMTTRGMPGPRGRGEIDEGQFDQPQEVFGASGGASMYMTYLFEKIGLFDEDFFAYFEDVDISFRAQLAGYKVRYEPSAVVYHEIGATSSKLGSFTRYHSIKNFIFLYNKNMPGWLYWKYKPIHTLQLFRMFGGCVRDGQILTFIKAWLKAATLIFSTLMKRGKIQKNRKVSARYIDSILTHSPPKRSPEI